jgi:hypothetical protein
VKLPAALQLILFGIVVTGSISAQKSNPAPGVLDSDHDGLSDVSEDRLLSQFLPTFMVSRHDCSVAPAQFVPDQRIPAVIADDGTIYAQAVPLPGHQGLVELHYYHLWRKDCGELGHALDTEHVSALIARDSDKDSATALYWYAAAHEDTICDASQMARAATVSAEDHGVTAWISPGKHASFLSEALCAQGCGGDRCEQMQPLQIHNLINLGELDAPMNDIAWLRAPGWPLQDKMGRSDFTVARVSRLDKLPATDVIWAEPSKRPAQATILGLNAGIGGALTGARSTDTALVVANKNTNSALGAASQKTANALGTSSRNVLHALKKSARQTGGFLHPNK